MRPSLQFGGIFALACAAMMFGCGESPSVSPSPVTGVATASERTRAREEAPAATDPAPTPAPGPTDPAPAPALPAPATVTISIVGSSGSQAYMPNPSQAAMGDQIIWTNSDRILHRIVMDDGTVIGDVAPGASTAPIALTNATATYHCEIHPSMVGGINVAPAPAPPPDYGYAPPPNDYYGGY